LLQSFEAHQMFDKLFKNQTKIRQKASPDFSVDISTEIFLAISSSFSNHRFKSYTLSFAFELLKKCYRLHFQ